MKKLLLLLSVIALNYSITQAQCPPGAFAYQSKYVQCPSGCGVLLLGWPEGVLVNIYGGSPLNIITSALISGTLGGSGTGDAFTCVPCNVPLVYASQITGAIGGCVIATIGIVPIQLTDFSASPGNGNTSLLKWTASQELGGVKYIVQKSEDSRLFNDLTTIKSTGNGRSSNTYSYEDLNNNGSNTYYRIKAIDVSGATTYSPVASVKKDASFGFSLYPNPVIDNLTVSIPEKYLPATIEIFNAMGQSVYRIRTTQSLQQINPSLKNGIYAVKVTSNSNLSTTQKLIKK